MAPSESEIIAKLKAGVTELFTGDKRETLTVKIVRNVVAENLGLDEGFFSDAKWKERSKKIIVDQVDHLQSLEEVGESALEPTLEKKKPAPAPKKVVAPPQKRALKPTAAEKTRPAKRQKKQATPSDNDLSASSALSDTPDEDSMDSGDSDASEPSNNKKGARKAKTPMKKGGKTRKQVDSSDEEDEDGSELGDESFGDSESEVSAPKKQTSVKKTAPKKAPAKKATKPTTKSTKSKAKVEDSESGNDSSALTTPSDSDEKPTNKGKTPKVESSDSEPEAPKSVKKAVPAPKPAFKKAPSPEHEQAAKEENLNASDSDMSIVLDEAPKPKRKRKGETKDPKSKTAKPKSAPKTSAPLSPQEEQIKALQSHLVKCGIRKIWAFELKQYGDDSSAKIKHLSKMLKDAGMVGRFSESRAREIKEMRELQADLQAVKEGEKSWGMESGRRSRSNATRKSMKDLSEDEDDEVDGEEAGGKRAKAKDSRGGDDESDDEDDMPPPRARRQNDLAFLGDESESD